MKWVVKERGIEREIVQWKPIKAFLWGKLGQERNQEWTTVANIKRFNLMANHLEPKEAISYRGLLMFVQYWDNVVSTNN